MVKKPLWAAASTASFSPRSATRTATMGPSGGGVSPNRRMSALLKGRSHANPLAATDHVRVPRRSPSVTSGNVMAISATASRLTMGPSGIGCLERLHEGDAAADDGLAQAAAKLAADDTAHDGADD